MWDDNNISIDGDISLATSENQKGRFEGAGWNYLSCDGHNFNEIKNAITKINRILKPLENLKDFPVFLETRHHL